MENILITKEKAIFSVEIGNELANAIRRSVNEIPTLAIVEADIYKNDSALYDDIVSHRLGLVPLKNQKLKKDGMVELKLQATGSKEGSTPVLSGELGELSVYKDIPITLLEKGQEIELVARAKAGRGKDHARHSPGLMYFRGLSNITISKDGEKHSELAEIYPEAFEFNGKLKVKNAWALESDSDDLKSFKGVDVSPTGKLVIFIESWGQMLAKEIFTEAIDTLSDNLEEVAKGLK